MAATDNSYIADQGELTFTISAAGATATGLTAGTYTADIVVRKFDPTEQPRRQSALVNVTGGEINIAGKYRGRYVYQLVYVDDYAKGETGELGTSPNEFTVYEMMQLHLENEVAFTNFKLTPAGNAAGMIQWTAVNCIVEDNSGPKLDANSTLPDEKTAVLSFTRSDFSRAVRA